MNLKDILYSINEYDSDGDITENGRGVFLHFGPSIRVKVADTFREFEEVVERIQSMVPEIRRNYLDESQELTGDPR